MPQAGGPIRRPPAPKKAPPKSTPVRGDQLGASNNAAVAAQKRTMTSVARSTVGSPSATSIVDSKRAAVQKAGTGGITKRREVSVQSDSKRLASAVKTGASKTASQRANAKKFGFKAPTGDQQRRKFGGTSGGGGGGGSVGDRTGGGNLGKPISEGGQNDGGRLSGAFRDSDLVGSKNDLTEFDGSSFSGGFDDVEGGGGGSGSSLAGKEAVGRVGDTQGQSLEEVVYGVNKRGRKVSRARGE